MLVLEKAHTDHDREIYFWRHGLADGRTVTYSSHHTNFTPHWCDWHNWGSSEPCDLCASGAWYPWPSRDDLRGDGTL